MTEASLVPPPGVVLVVNADAPTPFLHLHLESHQRFYPSVPLIVHGTGGEDDQLQALCDSYGVPLFMPSIRLDTQAADFSACLLAIQSAQPLNATLAVKMSAYFLPLADWVPQLRHLAALTDYATYSNHSLGQHLGFRSECVAFSVPAWSSEDYLQRLEQMADDSHESSISVGSVLHDLARTVHSQTQSDVNAAYERLYPREPETNAYGIWPWIGDDIERRRPAALWRQADTVLDYHRVALAFGLSYRADEFTLPQESLIAQCASPPPDPAEVVSAPVQAAPAKRALSGTMHAASYEARVLTPESGGFPAVTNSNVLIYFPHGFGDWVQFSALLPLLEPSNRYFMTRFGDDSSAIMEDCAFATPLYCGHDSPHSNDGEAFDLRNFGLNYGEIDGTVRRLRLPLSLFRQCQDSQIDVVFWSSLPEPWGESPYPFHTKPRYQLPGLVTESRLREIELGAPLRSPISFQSASWLLRWVESRLTTRAAFGERKLCLITRNGYTSVGKNWGYLFRDEIPGQHLREGQECRDFMRLLLKKDPKWMFLVMEDRLFEGDDTMRSEELHAYSYAELFGEIGGDAPPFGLIMKALVSLADLSIGVPAGPYHLSMVKEGLPTVGLWIDHFPSWYDEPKAESIHLISRNVTDQRMEQRPGSITSMAQLLYRCRWLDTKRIPGDQVLGAVEELLY